MARMYEIRRKRDDFGPPREQPGARPLDIHVGNQIRLRRTLVGMTHQQLAKILGIPVQQIQDYEQGVTRAGASRLFDLAGALDVPISFFFALIERSEVERPGAHTGGLPNVQVVSSVTLLPDQSSQHEAAELVRFYFAIENQATRKRVLDVIKSVSSAK